MLTPVAAVVVLHAMRRTVRRALFHGPVSKGLWQRHVDNPVGGNRYTRE
jgi:hypothetical protein